MGSPLFRSMPCVMGSTEAMEFKELTLNPTVAISSWRTLNVTATKGEDVGRPRRPPTAEEEGRDRFAGERKKAMPSPNSKGSRLVMSKEKEVEKEQLVLVVGSKRETGLS